jgi:hypothetical protein
VCDVLLKFAILEIKSWGGKGIEKGCLIGAKIQLDRKNKFQCSVQKGKYSLQQFLMHFNITRREEFKVSQNK